MTLFKTFRLITTILLSNKNQRKNKLMKKKQMNKMIKRLCIHLLIKIIWSINQFRNKRKILSKNLWLRNLFLYLILKCQTHQICSKISQLKNKNLKWFWMAKTIKISKWIKVQWWKDKTYFKTNNNIHLCHSKRTSIIQKCFSLKRNLKQNLILHLESQKQDLINQKDSNMEKKGNTTISSDRICLHLDILQWAKLLKLKENVIKTQKVQIQPFNLTRVKNQLKSLNEEDT